MGGEGEEGSRREGGSKVGGEGGREGFQKGRRGRVSEVSGEGWR